MGVDRMVKRSKSACEFLKSPRRLRSFASASPFVIADDLRLLSSTRVLDPVKSFGLEKKKAPRALMMRSPRLPRQRKHFVAFPKYIPAHNQTRWSHRHHLSGTFSSAVLPRTFLVTVTTPFFFAEILDGPLPIKKVENKTKKCLHGNNPWDKSRNYLCSRK